MQSALLHCYICFCPITHQFWNQSWRIWYCSNKKKPFYWKFCIWWPQKSSVTLNDRFKGFHLLQPYCSSWAIVRLRSDMIQIIFTVIQISEVDFNSCFEVPKCMLCIRCFVYALSSFEWCHFYHDQPGSFWDIVWLQKGKSSWQESTGQPYSKLLF